MGVSRDSKNRLSMRSDHKKILPDPHFKNFYWAPYFAIKTTLINCREKLSTKIVNMFASRLLQFFTSSFIYWNSCTPIIHYTSFMCILIGIFFLATCSFSLIIVSYINKVFKRKREGSLKMFLDKLFNFYHKNGHDKVSYEKIFSPYQKCPSTTPNWFVTEKKVTMLTSINTRAHMPGLLQYILQFYVQFADLRCQ